MAGLACGMLMGADGGIGSFYNLAPKLFVEHYNAAQVGDWAEARKTQDRKSFAKASTRGESPKRITIC